MSTLGLDGTPQKEDNLFKRLFWPSDSPYEVDMLGQQGMWVCLVSGALSSGAMAFGGHPLLALLNLLFYWVGGMGVREHAIAAAILVATGQVLNVLAATLAGMPPGALSLICTGLLLANVRGTLIAARWVQRAPQEFPERLGETITDKLIDQLPFRVWPKITIAFYSIASMYLALCVLGIGVLLARPILAQKSAKRPRQVELYTSPPLR